MFADFGWRWASVASCPRQPIRQSSRGRALVLCSAALWGELVRESPSAGALADGLSLDAFGRSWVVGYVADVDIPEGTPGLPWETPGVAPLDGACLRWALARPRSPILGGLLLAP